MRLLALFFALSSLYGCVHSPPKADTDPVVVKAAAEGFHRRVRWKDFQSASALVIPQRRTAFLEARERLHDEKDLTISDYELLELRVEPDASRAQVVSRVSWMRLPSMSEHTETVITELLPVQGVWLVARQNKGPFAEELSAPVEPRPAALPAADPKP